MKLVCLTVELGNLHRVLAAEVVEVLPPPGGADAGHYKRCCAEAEDLHLNRSFGHRGIKENLIVEACEFLDGPHEDDNGALASSLIVVMKYVEGVLRIAMFLLSRHHIVSALSN